MVGSWHSTVIKFLNVLPYKVYYVTFLLYTSVNGFIFEQFCFTTRQFPSLIMHGDMRNNSFDGILQVRERRKR